jgi:hypothetical protein
MLEDKPLLTLIHIIRQSTTNLRSCLVFFAEKRFLKNIFRQILQKTTPVDKVIHIIPVVSPTFQSFINKLITTYPPIIVNNWKGCST